MKFWVVFEIYSPSGGNIFSLNPAEKPEMNKFGDLFAKESVKSLLELSFQKVIYSVLEKNSGFFQNFLQNNCDLCQMEWKRLYEVKKYYQFLDQKLEFLDLDFNYLNRKASLKYLAEILDRFSVFRDLPALIKEFIFSGLLFFAPFFILDPFFPLRKDSGFPIRFRLFQLIVCSVRTNAFSEQEVCFYVELQKYSYLQKRHVLVRPEELFLINQKNFNLSVSPLLVKYLDPHQKKVELILLNILFCAQCQFSVLDFKLNPVTAV